MRGQQRRQRKARHVLVGNGQLQQSAWHGAERAQPVLQAQALLLLLLVLQLQRPVRGRASA
jgi:hypothetical protein